MHVCWGTLQVDCPDLGMGRHTKFKDCILEEFRAAARTAVKVMNEAVADIPADRMRMHVCWGNYPGPHHHDVPLADIIDVVLEAKPKYLSVEACNPGHGHDRARPLLSDIVRSRHWCNTMILVPLTLRLPPHTFAWPPASSDLIITVRHYIY